MKQVITEEMKVHEEWYKESETITLDKLPEFLNRLMNDYGHDYGTICHALAAGGIATMHAMNHHEQGGITGFQAGAIMWEFIRHWNYTHNKTGMKILDYDNFLYPQHKDNFDKTINLSIWNAIQKEAEAKIKEADEEHEKYIKDLEQYEIDMAAFVEKYPGYSKNPEKYEHLSYGTAAEWEKETEKVKNGFEFAPREPYDGPYGNSVYLHWHSIIKGIVPFGYKVIEE